MAKTSEHPPVRVPAGNQPRVVITNVKPQVDGGRYPVKRVVGERLEVSADIFKDGHDLMAGRLCYRAGPSGRWRTAPLAYEYDPDRWQGAFALDRAGRWQYTLEAWPDHWESWRSDLRKRVDAGQDVRSELLEGAMLLRRAAPHAPEAAREALNTAEARLEDPSLALELRLETAFSDELARHVAPAIDPEEITRYERVLEVIVDRPRAVLGAWYELFPRSQALEPDRHGTFRDVERRLPELARLGFDVVYLPPIHPIGHTHRKGPNNSPDAAPGDPGSPWAIGSEEGGHTAVHPELGTLDDFDHLVGAAKDLGLEIALDIAFQCSPDHPWLRQHPDWFFIRSDGTLRYAENPPKKYQDIYPLDYWSKDRQALWEACRDVFLFWIEHGVKIFRVDNPHTKAFAFWEWCLADLQRAHPDTIFLAEAFTRPNRMRGLARVGFNQSYTYFTWKNTAAELQEYLTELTGTEMAEYYRPNFFANTPDILHEYLQQGGRPAFRSRLLLAGTLSPSYGIYSGYELCENVPVRPGSEEYLHSEKYEIRQRDWNAPGNLNDDIARLNRIRRENPALQRLDNLSFELSENPSILWYRKSAPEGELLIAVNLDPHAAHDAMVHVPLEALGIPEDLPFEVEDLLTGVRYAWRGTRNYVRLDPREKVGHVLRVVDPTAKRLA